MPVWPHVDPPAASAIRGVLAALVDLVLPQACVSCEMPGTLLCNSCRHELGGEARLVWPRPTPAGLPPPYGVADYGGAARAAVLAHKEDGCFALAAPLGVALSASIRTAVAVSGLDPCDPVVLVPVPSSRAAVRSRGHDPLLRIARAAGRVLRRDGTAVRVASMLTLRRRVVDQAGLDSAQRAANLAGAVSVGAGPWTRWLWPAASRDRWAVRRCILVDDVITTGATLAEAAGALRAAGVEVPAAAVIAATVRLDSNRSTRHRSTRHDSIPARMSAREADPADYTRGAGATSVPSWHPPGSVVAFPERA